MLFPHDIGESLGDVTRLMIRLIETYAAQQSPNGHPPIPGQGVLAMSFGSLGVALIPIVDGEALEALPDMMEAIGVDLFVLVRVVPARGYVVLAGAVLLPGAPCPCRIHAVTCAVNLQAEFTSPWGVADGIESFFRPDAEASSRLTTVEVAEKVEKVMATMDDADVVHAAAAHGFDA